MGRVTQGLGIACAAAAVALATPRPAAASGSAAVAPLRAAYIYDYMSPSHVDSLAAAGFGRVVVRLVGDSVSSEMAGRVQQWVDRGRERGLEVVPDLLIQAPESRRLRVTTRRYTWGAGRVEDRIACPMDSLFWRSALLDHSEELLTRVDRVTRLAFDLEIYTGSRKYYDAGPCRCDACLHEYTGIAPAPQAARHAWRLSGLAGYEETRLQEIFVALFSELLQRHPGLEIGVFDLDLDSFVHRALARSLARLRVPVVDYCERSYSVGGAPLAGARARLKALGLEHARLLGGLWLKRWMPEDLSPGIRSILARSDGYFVFTTYSLWQEPTRLTGPYMLPGDRAAYWRAFREVNR